MIAEVAGLIAAILMCAYLAVGAINHEIEKEIKSEKQQSQEVMK